MAISVKGVNSWNVLTLQPIAAHFYMTISVRGVIPEKASHCCPLQPTLTWQFQSAGEFLKSPPILAHCSPLLHGNFCQGGGGGNSSKVLPLQPIAAHSYMAFLVRGVIPEKCSHCSPLQPTLSWQFQSGGNSWKVLPLQPIGGNSWKVPPLHPIAAHS